MNDVTKQCGYDDVIFLAEVPEFFYCRICTLVLRKPKQILFFDHKFCNACFKRFTDLSHNNNQPLVCPVDGKYIQLEDIVPDVGTERQIGN